jgi:outer membrane biosynthesis protein TonB
MLHGLLTEPIPENSFIYGGPVFWAKMKKFEDAGKVLSEDARAWLAMASAAQDAAEAIGGCKVQRVLVNDTQRMVKVKEKEKVKEKVKEKEKEKVKEKEKEKDKEKDKEKEKVTVKGKVMKEKTNVSKDEKEKVKVSENTLSLKSVFAPVEVRFTESEKAPVKIETDSINIRLEVIDGKNVWVAENGMMFEDVKGEPGEPLMA